MWLSYCSPASQTGGRYVAHIVTCSLVALGRARGVCGLRKRFADQPYAIAIVQLQLIDVVALIHRIGWTELCHGDNGCQLYVDGQF